MRRTFSVCATLAALSLVVSQQVRADDGVKGTYAFTLAEKCVQQVTTGTIPGFDPTTFAITDTNGAMTYGGASDGLIVFDGKGNVSLQQGLATNIMNAANFQAQFSPPPTPPATNFLEPKMIPFGLGFGPAIHFSCMGTYTVGGGKIAPITANLTCTAVITHDNPANPIAPGAFVTGFSSTFNMDGFVPRDPSHLVLTDIGDAVQPVTIFVNGGKTNGGADVPTQRVCTRSTNLVRVSP